MKFPQQQKARHSSSQETEGLRLFNFISSLLLKDARVLAHTYLANPVLRADFDSTSLSRGLPISSPHPVLFFASVFTLSRVGNCPDREEGRQGQGQGEGAVPPGVRAALQARRAPGGPLPDQAQVAHGRARALHTVSRCVQQDNRDWRDIV